MSETVSYQYGHAICTRSPREEFAVLAVFESSGDADRWHKALPDAERYEMRVLPFVKRGSAIDIPSNRTREHALRGRRERTTVRQWLTGTSS